MPSEVKARRLPIVKLDTDDLCDKIGLRSPMIKCLIFPSRSGSNKSHSPALVRSSTRARDSPQYCRIIFDFPAPEGAIKASEIGTVLGIAPVKIADSTASSIRFTPSRGAEKVTVLLIYLLIYGSTVLFQAPLVKPFFLDKALRAQVFSIFMVAFLLSALFFGVVVTFVIPFARQQLDRIPGFADVTQNQLVQLLVVGAIGIAGIAIFTMLARRIRA